MKNIWKSYEDIRKIAKGKKIIFWGRSDDWLLKTKQKIPDLEIDYIIDRSEAFKGKKFFGHSVYLPSRLEKEDKNSIFIIITASAYKSVILDLDKLNFNPGTDYCCSPEFKDWALLQDIKNYDTDIIISCSDNTLEEGGRRFSKMGGGLYLFNTKSNELVCKKQGHFRQIIEIDNLYYIVEYVEQLLYVFDKQFNVLNKIELDQSDAKDQKPNYCGLTYHKKSNQLFVTNAGTDTISIYDKENFELKKIIDISNKSKNSGGGLHHINDLTVVNDSLFVSCFSISGNWNIGLLDGGILEYDITDIDKPPNAIIKNLWKPHSIKYHNQGLVYLDSMNGTFHQGNHKILGKFNGFIRGLDYDSNFFFIGQSEDMYVSEMFGKKENIMLNAGVYLYQPESIVCRFYSFPYLSNIHDLKIHKN